MRASSLLAPAFLVLALARAAVGQPPALAPDLSRFEEGVREQLQEAAARVAALESAPQPDPDALAEAYGHLGRLYFVYDLNAAAMAALAEAERLDPETFDWPYILGVIQRLEAQLEAGEESLERALALRPDYAPGLARLAELCRERGRVEEAETLYARALELDPDLAIAHEGLGQLASERGDHEEAVARFQRVLELQPDANAVHHQLGLAFRALGDMEAARRHLAANRGGRVRIPDPVLDEAADLVLSSQLHRNTGVTAMRQGNFRLAVEELRKALEQDPDDAAAAYNVALAHMGLGEAEEAERWLRRAVELDPGFRNAHFNLGTLMAEQGRVAEAETFFRRAHEIDPNDEGAHLEWAKTLAALGQRERALTELASLLARDPQHPGALVTRGIVEAQLGREAAAEASFRGAVLAGSAEGSLELGILLERQQRWDEAEASYRAAIEGDPGLLEVWERLGGLLGRRGRYAEAAAAFEEVVSALPERVESRLARTTALLLAGDDRAALRTLEEGLAAQPDELRLAHLLARLLATSEEPEVRDGRRAVELAEAVLERSQTVEHAETVAMALAEAGRFEEATALQEQVVQQLETAGSARGAVVAQLRLEAYRRGEPVRTPWRGEGR